MSCNGFADVSQLDHLTSSTKYQLTFVLTRFLSKGVLYVPWKRVMEENNFLKEKMWEEVIQSLKVSMTMSMKLCMRCILGWWTIHWWSAYHWLLFRHDTPSLLFEMQAWAFDPKPNWLRFLTLRMVYEYLFETGCCVANERIYSGQLKLTRCGLLKKGLLCHS